jgi:hypothetical protein
MLVCLLLQVELPHVGGGDDDDADDADEMDVDEQQPSGPSSSGRKGRAGACCPSTAQHTAPEGLACIANMHPAFIHTAFDCLHSAVNLASAVAAACRI